ncbi:MAG: aldehyde dehydrogenase family protein [Gammaproteobacteria bacterium]|nr:aldehyde dehydrogenase family protein [Gammaproteobacteria bacterium]
MIAVRNPRTGQQDFSFEPPAEAALAARCAELRRAQPAWWQAGMEHRIAVLRRWADAIDAHRDAIAGALAIDTGRTAIALGEVRSASRNIRRWCDYGPTLIATPVHESGVMPSLRYSHQLVPYALVGGISPWNFPVALSLIDSVPALLAGCAVFVKPSEVTPRFVAPLKLAVDAVPELARVFDIAAGDGATGAALIRQVDAVCFTGSVATGRKVAVAAAERFIPAFLELGGKDPAIILPSANLEDAADAILRGSVVASGQVCLSLERVYVHESCHDAFVDLLTGKARQVQLNYPDIDRGDLGPLIFARQADIIDEHLDDAVAKGATIACGGKTRNLGGGRYCEATVLTNVNHTMKVMTDETFGPVIPVMAFRTVDEAVALANDSEYGLSAAVFAATLDEARAVGERINAGGISLNDAALTRETYEAEKNSFGYSGMGGSRMGAAGLLRFYRKKALLMQTGKPAKLV